MGELIRRRGLKEVKGESSYKYYYETGDGFLYLLKGAPPSGSDWELQYSNGVRSCFVLLQGDSVPFNWASNASSLPDYGKTFYPIPIPRDATKIKVSTSSNRRIGPSFWTFNGTTYTRRSDPGWQSVSGGYVTYSFSANTYDYLCMNIDSGTVPSSATLEFLTS